CSREIESRDVSSGAVVASVTDSSGANGLAWDPDGHTLAAACTQEKQVCLYDRGSWRLYRTVDTVEHCTCVDFDPTGHRLAVSGWGGRIELVDAGHGPRPPRRRPRLRGAGPF